MSASGHIGMICLHAAFAAQIYTSHEGSIKAAAHVFALA